MPAPSCLDHNQGTTMASEMDATSALTGIGMSGSLCVLLTYSFKLPVLHYVIHWNGHHQWTGDSHSHHLVLSH